jgi:hypothetical protein
VTGEFVEGIGVSGLVFEAAAMILKDGQSKSATLRATDEGRFASPIAI